jgi:hypothetical protein
MYATGGRGGEVYEVTTLADSGPGSLRDAVSKDNRTIVFRVSGNIYLEGGLDITGSNLTIAGQTAPGDGICVVGNETTIIGSNVIIRYLRFRGTDMLGTPIDTFKGEGVSDVIIDHCSISWGVDECFSVYGNRNVTVQWCLIAEGLAMSAHEKGRHGYGGIWGGDNVTYHHNLLIHQGGRNPRFGFVEDVDLRVDHRYNVIYNYGFTSCYGGEWSNGINIVGNYYKPGPDTLEDTGPVIVAPGRIGRWYVADNVVEGHPDVTEDNVRGIDYPVGGITLLDEPDRFPNELPAQTAEEAFEEVLANVGAILPRRDSVDARLIADVRNGTGRIINSQTEVGGVPPLASTPAPVDSDHDGMPDDWEIEHGLDPNDPSDANEVRGGNRGYTNLEVYLNSIKPLGKGNPTVRFVTPKLNQVFASRATTQDITLEVEAQAAEGESIAKVDFYANETLVGTATEAPFRVVWSDVSDGTYYLTARATDSLGTSTSSTCTPVHVNRTTSLPSPWKSRDIGDVPIPGSAALVNNVFTVKGSGKIRGRKDAFHFVYQPIDAPANDTVEIFARIDHLSRVYQDVFAGLMIREKLDPDSPYMAAGLVWGEGGLKGHVTRIAASGTEPSISPYPWDDETLDDRPYYIRLTKRGTEFEAFLSSDSLQWTRIGYERIDMADRVFIGLAVDGNKEANQIANYTTARFSLVRVNQ